MTTAPSSDDKKDSVTVVFIRHAKTATTGEVLPGRAPGLHLTEEGTKQASAVSIRLKDDLAIAGIYSSPLERAMETAGPSAETLKLPIVPDERLYECDFGEWTQAPLSELRKLPEWKSLMNHPEKFQFPGGESLEEVRQRISSFVADMRQTHGGKTVLAFSHADPIKVALTAGFGLGLEHFHHFIVSTTSTSALLYSSAKTVVISVNSQINILDKHELDALTEYVKKEGKGE